MATEEEQEYERKLLSKFPTLDNKFPRTIYIPLSSTVRSIKTREELMSMAPRNESSGPFTVGDLLWARMSGYPPWPAMISRDPTDGRFCKSSVAQGSTYHVQYFGEATRGWTQAKMFWPFVGPDLLNSSGKSMLPKINKRKKLYEEAISEALQALKMEPQMRIKRLTYNYILTDPMAPTSVKKAPPSIKKRRVPSKVKSSNDESIYDFDETIDDFEPEEDKLLGPLKWSRPREVTPPREATPPRDENDESEKDDLPATPIMARDDSSDEMEQQSRAEEAKEQEQEAKPEDNKEQEAVPKLDSSDDAGQQAVIEEVKEERKPDQGPQGRRTRSMPRREMSPINDNAASQPNKRMRGSSVVKRPPPPPADVMTSSEDASSTSDLEAPDVRLDKLCNVCHEETGPFYFCSGTCLRTMHAGCGGSESTNNNSENFICQECRTGKHPCFVCKSTDGDTYKCCHKNCGKYYHLGCLDPNCYPASIRSGQTFTCPIHHCLTCYTDLPYPRDINCIKPSKRQLLKCLSCPTAFHNDDACTAPGTVLLAGSYVMCPAHRIPSSKNDRNVNVSWCFSCNEGGELICCESCPAAFHAECIDNPPSSDEQYFCYDCQNRKQLHYGDILWIKSGSYRWWPAKIIHPNAVPDNIMNLSHTRGDFPVYFFGTHDYNWSHRGRVFAYVEEDGQVKLKASSSDKKPAYKLAVQEARTEYLQRMKHEEERREKLKNMEKPRFKLIKQNRPINDVVQSTPDDIKLSSKQRCDCKADGEILCGTEECINVAMMIECDPSTCPVKEKCKNQRFRKRQYPVVVPFRTDSVGWGLRTTQDIKMGEFVIEYVGELIDEATCNKRMEEKMDRGDTTFYFLTIDKERIIDAGPMANHARFMNHSCQPNCETQKWVVNGQTKVGLFAICDIPAGSELTFNYNLDCRGNEKMKCRCRSENCSGYIGLPVKNARKGS